LQILAKGRNHVGAAVQEDSISKGAWLECLAKVENVKVAASKCQMKVAPVP
jgi:hypothetical protein